MKSRSSLVVRDAGGVPRTITLPVGPVTIGRDPGCGVRLDDPSVSWRHARIESGPDECFIEDLGSTNGIRVGGRPVRRILLADGDALSVGAVELVYRRSPDSPSVANASERTLAAASPQTLAAMPLNGGVGGSPESPAAAPQPPGGAPRRRGPSLPALAWLRAYGAADLRADALAGATVAVMLVPQGMAYAVLAGLPPVAGLYACLLPLLLYALFGSSRQLSVAPVALDSMLLAAGLSTLALAGSEAYVALAGATALLVGLMQVAMGALRLGFVVNFLSSPVMCGFSAAAAVIIAFSQLANLLALPLPQSQRLDTILAEVWARREAIHLPTLALGIGCIAALVGLRRFRPNWPGPLLVMAAATLVVLAAGGAGIRSVGMVPAGLPGPVLPAIAPAVLESLLPLALTLALVGFAQSIAVAKSLARKTGDEVDADQELRAIGAANLGAAFSQGFPVSGGLSRSALNARAGARTPLAGVFAALGVGLTLCFTTVFAPLPVVALAAVIIVAVTGLIDLAEVRHLFRVKRSEGLLVLFTFAATLVTGAMNGLAIGIAASILLFVALNTRPPTAILGRLPGTTVFRNIAVFPEAETVLGLVVLRVDASFYFANAEFLKATVRRIVTTATVETIVIDASSINDLDSTGEAALRAIAGDLRRRGIELLIAGIKNPVRQVMKRSGLYDEIGGQNFYYTIDAAVQRHTLAASGG